MSAKKIITFFSIVCIVYCSTILLFVNETLANEPLKTRPLFFTATEENIAEQLGWVVNDHYLCGGYYLEEPFIFPIDVATENDLKKTGKIEITSNQGLLSQLSTSTLEGQVTVTRDGQQITANKAYLYRNPTTGKLNAIDMLGNVHLREPNTLVIGKEGHYDFETKTKALRNIIFRTTLNSMNSPQIAGPHITPEEREKQRKITGLTAWGHAHEFSQTEPKVYEISQTTYSTCPPLHPAWQVKAKHIVLNKNTGRGYATHARLYIKNVPVFYTPYLNFSIDHQRKSGFLTPTPGRNTSFGPYLLLPYYWNIAPNYDMTITPGFLTNRGTQFSDTFRYLTETSRGKINANFLPDDRGFKNFQRNASINKAYTQPTNTALKPVIQSELNRLLSDSSTREAFSWRENSQFNPHWSSHVDFNYASDDYYLQDFGSNLTEITQNQLLQEGDLYYKNPHWNFTGTLQAYQTLNPINETLTETQYRRLPQLILNGDYPDQLGGLEYFVNTSATRFDIRNTPGAATSLPVGDRLHLQPGFNLPIYEPAYYINPRLQFALTTYSLHQTAGTGIPNSKNRAIPIFDIASGMTFERDTHFFGHGYEQTLEPQLYYEYIPYRNQASIPVFDTTVNTLFYSQLFNYNRFSGLDRIGDANQLSAGLGTRFIDEETGYEKIHLAVGEIFYFADRRVTLCNSDTGPFACNDNPDNPANHYSLSPISGELDYNINPAWKFTASPIWNPITKQLDNMVVAFQYEPDNTHLVNIGYNFAHSGDISSGIETDTSKNNLKLTDISFAWPLINEVSVVGRWSQDFSLGHLQNLLYGIQYNSCCWAVRAVGGKVFTGIDPIDNNKFQYDTQFYIQFDLKGLGNIETGDAGGLLSSITGYHSQFGQET